MANTMHAVEPLRGLGQRQVFLIDVLALSQRHVTHQEQPRAVGDAGLRVLQAGAAAAES